MTWRVEFTSRAHAELLGLDRPTQERILPRLARLADGPHAAANVKALGGGHFRLRVGDWRVVYALEEAERLILVLKVAHRREAYR